MNFPGSINSSKSWIRVAFPAALLSCLASTFFIASFLGKLGDSPSILLLAVGFIPLHGIGFGLFILWTHRLAPAKLSEALELPNLKANKIFAQFVAAASLAFAFLLLSLLVSLAATVILEHLGIHPAPSPFFDYMRWDRPGLFIAALCGVTILAPVSEEILFRLGFHDFLKSFNIPAPGIWVAIVFAAIHGQLHAIPALFMLSLVLQRARKISGSMYSPIFIHGFYNLFATSFFLGASIMKDLL